MKEEEHEKKQLALEKEQRCSKKCATKASCKVGKNTPVVATGKAKKSTLSNSHHSKGQNVMLLRIHCPATLLQVTFQKQMSVMLEFVHLKGKTILKLHVAMHL